MQLLPTQFFMYCSVEGFRHARIIEIAIGLRLHQEVDSNHKRTSAKQLLCE